MTYTMLGLLFLVVAAGCAGAANEFGGAGDPRANTNIGGTGPDGRIEVPYEANSPDSMHNAHMPHGGPQTGHTGHPLDTDLGMEPMKLFSELYRKVFKELVTLKKGLVNLALNILKEGPEFDSDRAGSRRPSIDGTAVFGPPSAHGPHNVGGGMGGTGDVPHNVGSGMGGPGDVPHNVGSGMGGPGDVPHNVGSGMGGPGDVPHNVGSGMGGTGDASHGVGGSVGGTGDYSHGVDGRMGGTGDDSHGVGGSMGGTGDGPQGVGGGMGGTGDGSHGVGGSMGGTGDGSLNIGSSVGGPGDTGTDHSDSVQECISTTDPNGADYRGHQATSVTGRPCLMWAEMVFPPHLQTYRAQLDAEANYCRNHGGMDPGPFCFVGIRMHEPCFIPRC